MGPGLGGAVPYPLCLEGPVHEDGLGGPQGASRAVGRGWGLEPRPGGGLFR